MRREGLTESDWSAWQALERLVEIGWVRSIGVSNFSESQLRTLFSEAKVKPTFVQNRCYPSIRWDLPVRNLCKSLGIIYQGFNLLRDPILAQSVVIANLCARYEMPLGQLIYSFALQSHILPITGARNLGRLQENLSAKKDVLAPEDLAAIEKVAVG
jgi:diketogulonate reductase-like aldo/keto reductase